MTNEIRPIPRPLVRTNQWVILLSVTTALLTGQIWILLIPLAAGLSGLLFHFNLVMRLAKLFLKKKPSDYIPEDHSQQQFNQVIAVVCLGLGLISFLLGWTLVGYIFTLMVGLASLIAILGFCIGCFILFQWKRYSHQRSLH
ncbi:hypothetical protein SRABI96_04259 [Peribacillus sp. Bi96]|uniref:DUF4395 domain-containing protein n=1 Tax=Peribacillus sp. Bi96 TaxID=2884273 RepID=UPI001D3334E3|nr:DUF4395 domain-containing protein [Peribacillus sp. Bi96]CAH0290837.1 hypothetical protein SRABI96_04259 [Peribacillus sp. Bi96]